MATAADLRRMALKLEGTTEAPHFDRAAFKVARIYVTLAADAVPNAWGKQGWTTATLSALSAADLRSALETAWAHALPKQASRRPKKADARSRTGHRKP